MHEFEHLFLVATYIGTQGTVAIGAEALDDAVNHGGAEDIVLLEHGALLLQAVGRSLTAIGQAGQ